MNGWVKIALIATTGLLLLAVGFLVAPSHHPEEENAPAPALETPRTPDASVPDAALPSGPTLVEANRELLSPMTSALVARLRGIIRPDDEDSPDVFAKIGGSSTVSRAFLHCFAGNRVDLGDFSELESTRAFFAGGRAARTSPFQRESLSAGVGWHTGYLLSGHPPRFLREIRRIKPRYAFLLVGGNDVAGEDPFGFTRRLVRMVDDLIARNTIPILGTLQPRRHRPAADAVISYNRAIRAVADAKRLPIIDYFTAMQSLPHQGLAGDGVHPNVKMRGPVGLGCDLSEEGLLFGTNTRNLLSLQMLDRLHKTLDDDEIDSDTQTPELTAHGEPQEEVRILRLPYAQVIPISNNSFTHRFVITLEDTQNLHFRAVALCDDETGCPRRRTDPLIQVAGSSPSTPASEGNVRLPAGETTFLVQPSNRRSRTRLYLFQLQVDSENGD